MKFRFNKKSILLMLFGIAILFLVANLVVEFVIEDVNQNTSKSKVTVSEIDSLFHLSLDSFGFLDEWIIKKKSDKDKRNYKVKVPSGLSIPVILTEININFWEKDVTITSEEKKFSGKSILEISTKDGNKLISEFYYDKNIHRTAGTVAFILENFKLTDVEDSLLIEIPEPFSPLFIPSTDNIGIGKYIKDRGKTYSLLLNDNVPELKYKLKDSYSEKRLKGSLLSIINDFSSASYFIIDDQSDIYNSPVYFYLKNELAKRKIKVIKISSLQKLDYDDTDLLIHAFDTVMKDIGDGQSITFLITPGNFRALLPEIKRYRKVGYRLIHPSEASIEQE